MHLLNILYFVSLLSLLVIEFPAWTMTMSCSSLVPWAWSTLRCSWWRAPFPSWMISVSPWKMMLTIKWNIAPGSSTLKQNIEKWKSLYVGCLLVRWLTASGEILDSDPQKRWLTVLWLDYCIYLVFIQSSNLPCSECTIFKKSTQIFHVFVDSSVLKTIEGAHLDCVIKKHPGLDSMMHLLSENVLVSGDENIPGLAASPTGKPHVAWVV